MKKIIFFIIFLLLLSGCASSKKMSVNKTHVNESESNIVSKTDNNLLNLILIDSGVFSQNIYNSDKDKKDIIWRYHGVRL